MRKLIVAEFISLDGVIQGPGGPDEDTRGGFRYGGWQVPYSDEVAGEAIGELFEQPFELLLGRNTYNIFASYWPHVGSDSPARPIADLFNSVKKHVATHHPETLDWHNSHALEGDIADAVRALQNEDGGYLLIHGSGETVRRLFAAGLVDELRLFIYPILLGQGKRLFGDNARPSAFRLAHAITTPSGVLITQYLRDGEVRTGSFNDVE